MSGSKVIGVFGLSGVGKTSLIQSYIDTMDGNAKLASAGQLIMQARRRRSPYDALRSLGAKELMINQEILVRAFNVFRNANPTATILLDGHSVISSGADLVIVPPEIVSRLCLDQLVFISASPSLIYRNRLSDSSRSRDKKPVEQLAREQDIARRACQLYSAKLQLTLAEIESGDLTSFGRAISCGQLG